MSGPENYSNVMELDHSHNDLIHLAGIFPREIWLQILDNLGNAEDLKNVSQASWFFAELLSPRKVEMLFPQVWEILGKKLHENRHWLEVPTNDDLTTANNGSVINRQPPWFRPILSLRCMNRAWKDVIDGFYYYHSFPSGEFKSDSMFTNAGPDPLLWMSWSQESFISGSLHKHGSISEFLAHFNQSHGSSQPAANPFLAKEVYFNVPLGNTSDFQQFDLTCSELLSKYGRHILLCHFEFDNEHVTPKTFMKLRKWLSLLPNVISLEIDFDHIFWGQGCPPCTLETLYPELNSLAAWQPLPKLENLEYLSLFQIAPFIANPFLRANNHVAILHLDAGCHTGELDIHSVSFPNLTELNITYRSDTAMNFETLNETQFSRSFRSLSVNIERGRPPLREMFSLWASKWGDTLTHLKICVPSLRRGRASGRVWGRAVQQIENLQKEYLPRVKCLQLFQGD